MQQTPGLCFKPSHHITYSVINVDEVNKDWSVRPVSYVFVWSVEDADVFPINLREIPLSEHH